MKKNNKLAFMSTAALVAVAAIGTPTPAQAADVTKIPDGALINPATNNAFHESQIGLSSASFEIIQAINKGQDVYFKLPGSDIFINASDGNMVPKSVISALPALTYTGSNGTVTTIPGEVVSSDLKVESVTAINASELVVSFSKELDATTAVDLTKYSIDGVTLDTTATYGTIVPKLSTDKKSVTFKLDVSKPWVLAKGTSYRVAVDKAVTDKAGNQIVAYDKLFNFDDSNAPTVKSAVYSHADTNFVINFSEPLATGAASKVKVYDENNNDVTASIVTLNSTQDKITVAATSLTAAESYRVVIQGATDLSGNYFTGNKLEYTFTKSAVDTVKPTVTNLEAKTTRVVRATFSEPIFVGAASKIAEITLDGNDLAGSPGVTVVKEASDLLTAGNAVDVNGDGKTWDIAVVTSTNPVLGGVHTIALSEVFDLQNNKIAAAFSKLVQFSADTSAPGLVSYTTAGTKLFLTFDENTAGLTAGTPTVLNPDFVEKTTGSLTPTHDNLNTKVVVIDLGAANITKGGQYTVTIPSGMIKDASNNTKSYTVTTNFSPADTKKPTLLMSGASVDATAVVQSSANNNIFTIKFSEGVGTSALDVNNYTINGEKVFKNAVYDGTDVTKATIKLTLKDNALSVGGDLLIGVSNVADFAGNVMNPVTTVEAGIKDNTAPTYTAKLIASDKIELTFSEAVMAVGAGVISDADFNVYVGGTKATLANATIVATATGANKLTITLTAPIANLSQTIEVEASAAADIVDANKAGATPTAIGNPLATGKVVVTQ